MDEETARERLKARLAELHEEERLGEADRAPVTLDQDSVGRLSRIDAMQVQAMALAVQRRRAAEKERIAAALKRLDEGEFGWCLHLRGGDRRGAPRQRSERRPVHRLRPRRGLRRRRVATSTQRLDRPGPSAHHRRSHCRGT